MGEHLVERVAQAAEKIALLAMVDRFNLPRDVGWQLVLALVENILEGRRTDGIGDELRQMLNRYTT